MATQGISIITNNLGKRFTREWIFRNFTFEFKPGKITAITGPNGSGKSTLIQVLSAYTPPSFGSIKFVASDEKEISHDEIFRNISIAAPYMDLIDEYTLIEQLRFHFALRKIRGSQSIEELIHAMYLEKSANKAIGNFSSGMKQRVKLALAFYSESDIILLDEPGTNLDQEAFNWYLGELRKLPRETSVIIASNNPAEYPDATEKINILDYKR